MELADGKRTFGLAQGRGEVYLIDSKGCRCTVTLKNALYIPSFPQLFLDKSATTNGANVLINESKDVLVMPDGTRFGTLFRYLYYIQTDCGENDVCNVSYANMA